MKNLIFLALMCFSLSVFAFNPVDVDSSVSATQSPIDISDCMAGCSSEVISNTEIADSTSVTGRNMQTNEIAGAQANEGFESFSSESLAIDTPYEVGWRSRLA